MEQRVWLTVRGEQDYEGVGKDSTEQHLPGTMEETAEGIRLRYEERGEDGAVTRTVLTLTEGRAVLRRTGAVKTEMLFERGRAHSGFYAMPFGALPMTVEAERVMWKRTARGLLAEVRYRIELAGQRGVCTLKLRAQPKDADGAT